jgi:hypothetical protein
VGPDVNGTVPDQVVNCVLCGGESTWRFSAHDGLRTTDQPFSMLRCGDCGLFSLSPSLTPEEALGHYPADYQPFRSMLGVQLHPWARWLERLEACVEQLTRLPIGYRAWRPVAGVLNGLVALPVLRELLTGLILCMLRKEKPGVGEHVNRPS